MSKAENISYRVKPDGFYGELFVPMELPSAKFFKGDRGKNKENGQKDRMD